MATGFEITGVVLGAFPLLIAGLKHYADGVDTIARWWRYDREVASLRRLLLAEGIVFQGTCEQLLSSIGIAPGPELEELIDDAASPRWKDADLDRKLQEALGRSYASYLECVKEMQAIMTKLQDTLELAASDKPASVTVQQFKRIKFSLQKSKQEETFQKLAKNNNLIQTFVAQNVDIEPIRKRRRRSETDLRSIREHAKSLYIGIQSRWSCRCSSHLANLPLDPVWPARHPQAEDAGSVSRHGGQDALQFKVIFSKKPAHASGTWTYQETKIEIRPHEGQGQNQEAKNSGSTYAIATTHVGTKQDKGKTPVRKRDKLASWFSSSKPKTPSPDPSKPKKSIKFSDETPPNAPQPAVKVAVAGAKMAVAGDPPSVEDLCAVLSQMKLHGQPPVCLGRWHCEGDVSLAIYPLQTSEATCSMQELVSMTHFLSPPAGGPTPRLSYGDRLQLAHLIASSVLRFSKTPWLPDRWTQADILIARDEDRGALRERVFLSKAFPADAAAAAAGAAGSADAAFPGLRNPTLFTLGLVLIELCLNRPLAALRAPSDPLDAAGRANALTDWCTGTRLLAAVAQEAGNRYGDAVRRCIYCDFDQRVAELDNEGFRQAVHDGVVAPLREILQDFQAG